jgi:hypothetical protein
MNPRACRFSRQIDPGPPGCDPSGELGKLQYMATDASHDSTDRVTDSRVLRSLALGFACLVTAMGSAFIAGYAMDDPGGLEGVGLVLLWAVPLGVLALLAWQRPERAVVVLEVLTAAVIAVAVSFAVAPSNWRSFENGHGPVRAIGVFVLMLPVAILGWHRPRLAGWMLLIIGVVPMVLSTTPQGSGSMRAIAVPAAIDGAIFLLASVRAGHHGTVRRERRIEPCAPDRPPRSRGV